MGGDMEVQFGCLCFSLVLIQGERGWCIWVGRALRHEVVVVLVWGHLNEGVLQVCFARGFLGEPDFVETLSTDAAAEVGMEL
jgi:hypothetical protein